MTRWGLVNPSEVDTCPLNQPRPMTYLATGESLSSINGCPPLPNPCGECQGFSQGGETQFSYDVGTTILNSVDLFQTFSGDPCPQGYGNPSYAFPSASCQSFFVTGGGLATNTFSHLETADIGCGTSDTSCLFSTNCGSAQQAGSGLQIGNGTRRGEWETTLGAEFEITRHDLLSSIPDVSDWPQNV